MGEEVATKSLLSLGPAPAAAQLGIGLALVTALLHLYLTVDAIIYLQPVIAVTLTFVMGAGYLVFVAAFLVTNRKQLMAWVGIGYTLPLIGVYFTTWRHVVPMDWRIVTTAAMAIEVLLVVVLVVLSFRLRGHTGLPGRVR